MAMPTPPVPHTEEEMETLAPPVTDLVATLTPGIGVTLSWTVPDGFEDGLGYYPYRKSTFDTTPNRIGNARPGVYIALDADEYVDRECGYPAVGTGSNVYTYYLRTISEDGFEGPFSEASNTVTFVG